MIVNVTTVVIINAMTIVIKNGIANANMNVIIVHAMTVQVVAHVMELIEYINYTKLLIIKIMQNEYVSNLCYLQYNTNVPCSAGDGCDCDGDVDECIGNGQD